MTRRGISGCRDDWMEDDQRRGWPEWGWPEAGTIRGGMTGGGDDCGTEAGMIGGGMTGGGDDRTRDDRRRNDWRAWPERGMTGGGMTRGRDDQKGDDRRTEMTRRGDDRRRDDQRRDDWRGMTGGGWPEGWLEEGWPEEGWAEEGWPEEGLPSVPFHESSRFAWTTPQFSTILIWITCWNHSWFAWSTRLINLRILAWSIPLAWALRRASLETFHDSPRHRLLGNSFVEWALLWWALRKPPLWCWKNWNCASSTRAASST